MATARPKRDIDPATPLHQLPGDLLLTTARRLGELGFDAELAEAIRQPTSEVVRHHLIALRAELLGVDPVREVALATSSRRQRPRLIRGLYTPPELQLENVQRWNRQRKWSIPQEWFEKLGPAPAWPDGKLSCVTLEVALPDSSMADGGWHTTPIIPGMIRTVRELWRIIEQQHPSAERWALFHMDAEHLELLDGATYEPGLRWRVLDLTAHRATTKEGILPTDVRNLKTSPNVDGFATLAHHPKYAQGMNGITVPFLWIPGFVVSVPGHDPRRHVPIVHHHRDGRPMCLTAFIDTYQSMEYWVVPARREPKRAA